VFQTQIYTDFMKSTKRKIVAPPLVRGFETPHPHMQGAASGGLIPTKGERRGNSFSSTTVT